SLEATRAVDTVVFDKTGTLTTGRLQVSAVTAAPGWEADQVLALAATVEAASEHSVALAIAAATTRRDAVTALTCSRPVVRVPVLSKTTVSTARVASND
ncbi:hypothetical protein, partial [Mycobacterium tuberculosis]|uniref:hypothetical protein n=1 Tax=Mycobacterium tuberculosis TaxID=1773 RepID=UPI003013069B